MMTLVSREKKERGGRKARAVRKMTGFRAKHEK